MDVASLWIDRAVRVQVDDGPHISHRRVSFFPAWLGARTLLVAKGIATRNKGLTTRNKKLVETIELESN